VVAGVKGLARGDLPDSDIHDGDFTEEVEEDKVWLHCVVGAQVEKKERVQGDTLEGDEQWVDAEDGEEADTVSTYRRPIYYIS
jgi:hypothetical protein